MDTLTPIILFVYNRPEHTQKTIEYLCKNRLAESSNLFIFSDGPKKEKDRQRVTEARNCLKNIQGFKEIKITEREKNLGLANSVISGVSEIFKSYNKVIVLEDDILSSPSFLKFMMHWIITKKMKEYFQFLVIHIQLKFQTHTLKMFSLRIVLLRGDGELGKTDGKKLIGKPKILLKIQKLKIF